MYKLNLWADYTDNTKLFKDNIESYRNISSITEQILQIITVRSKLDSSKNEIDSLLKKCQPLCEHTRKLIREKMILKGEKFYLQKTY